MIDINRPDALRDSIEALFFAYRAFTEKPDRILARRGLGRVHHRILYFVGRNPGIAVNGLLEVLAISKQALNAPLRQLLEMKLVSSQPSPDDGRIRRLQLTAAGVQLERQLTDTQMKMLEAVFTEAGPAAEADWRRIMKALAEQPA